MTHLNNLVASTKSLLKYLAVMLALASSMAPQLARAVPIDASIGYGAHSNDGSYHNAQYIADNLVYTNYPVQASNSITIVESVNLGTSNFGLPAFGLTLTAPVLNLNYNMNISPFGQYFLTVNTINMAEGITNTYGGGLIDPSRVVSIATQINVLNNAVNLQQVIDFTSSTAPSSINAQFGNATSLAFNADNNMILSGGLLSGTVAMNSLDSSLVLHGHDFQLNTGAGFAGIGTGLIGPTSGQLNGFLNSGNPFAVSFTQGASGQISLVSSSVSAVPELGTVWLLSSGLIGLVAWQLKRAV